MLLFSNLRDFSKHLPFVALLFPGFGFWCSSQSSVHFSGEKGMVDEAQKALEEAEALKKVFNS